MRSAIVGVSCDKQGNFAMLQKTQILPTPTGTITFGTFAKCLIYA